MPSWHFFFCHQVTKTPKGYRAALTGVAVSNNITGPYKYIRSVRPNAGKWPLNFTEEQNKITFGSQRTCVLPVKGKKDAFIFMADRWTPENLADSRYIWLPVEWEKDIPVIKWYPEWDLSKMK